MVQNGKVCLPIKKTRFGAGKRNGYGGSVEQDESFRVAASREVLEEARIKVWPDELRKIAYLIGHNVTEADMQYTYEVMCFVAASWLGEPQETKEMGKPKWFPFDKLPVGELLPDNRDWLSKALIDVVLKSGKRIPKVEIWYGPKQASLVKPTRLVWFKPLKEE